MGHVLARVLDAGTQRWDSRDAKLLVVRFCANYRLVQITDPYCTVYGIFNLPGPLTRDLSAPIHFPSTHPLRTASYLSMTDTLNMTPDPDPGDKGDGQPDPDAECATEKGAEAVQITTWPPIQQLPKWRGIPDSLYEKAHDDPTQLTDEERQLLLSRGDVVGKALATPTELTTAEIHEVLLWPPPDVTSANIQRATGGTLNSPVELFAKAKDAIDRRQLDALLSHEEMALLARFFHGPDDEDFSHRERKRRVESPGPGRAYNLVFSLIGVDDDVMVFATSRMWQRTMLVQRTHSRPPREPVDSLIPEGLEGFCAQLKAAEDAVLANFPTQSDTSWLGSYRPVPAADSKISVSWPPNHRKPISAFDAFRQDIETGCSGNTLDSPEWHRLREARKDEYRARADAIRREAWAEFEKASAARAPGEIHRKQGFELFHVALGTSVTFQEALTKWDAFTEIQRRDWEVCALGAFAEEQRRRQDEWEMRDLSPEEREDCQAPPLRGRRKYETVAQWKTRRAQENAIIAEGGPEAEKLVQNLAYVPPWWPPSTRGKYPEWFNP